MRRNDITKLWAASYRMMMSVISEVAPSIGQLGLEVKELFVLEKVDEYSSPAALAEVLVMPKPTVTVYLKKLESLGFVKREIDADDLRRFHITLTAAGRKTMLKGSTLLHEAYARRLARLTATQQGQLSDMLDTMDETPEK